MCPCTKSHVLILGIFISLLTVYKEYCELNQIKDHKPYYIPPCLYNYSDTYIRDFRMKNHYGMASLGVDGKAKLKYYNKFKIL